MSSLMQHHGTIKGGKVELLMYRIEHVERPLNCNECGHPWKEGERNCSGCGKFVLFVWEYPKHRKLNERPKELLKMADAIEFPEYQKAKSTDDTCSVSNRWKSVDSEPVELTRPDGTKTLCAKLYRIWRAPKGMWGCWVVFRWEGEDHVPDLSVPISVETLPRDAEPLTTEEAEKYWFTP